ncbi:uncharacterized protein LOC134180703 [Corticium candelabrum]|uniref:uncharacterized protein LOC134180703 n=1 Tax=Corticium candelabrum TaxID=121492 RepID=UPI002E262EBF|nr:uncharacterized protein LOC134180703 [Corticium candelabrum]
MEAICDNIGMFNIQVVWTCNVDDGSSKDQTNQKQGSVDAHAGTASAVKTASQVSSPSTKSQEGNFVDLFRSEDRSQREIQPISDAVKEKVAVTPLHSDGLHICNGTQLE